MIIIKKNNFIMISEAKFNRVMYDLSQFGTQGHERLEVRRGILRAKSRGTWLSRIIQHFYKPSSERLRTVTSFALYFFYENQEHFTDARVLQKLEPIFRKANLESKFNQLINEIYVSALETSMNESVVEEIADHEENARQKVLSSYLCKEAIDLARDIPDPEVRAKTLASIADKQLPGDRDGAMETLGEAVIAALRGAHWDHWEEIVKVQVKLEMPLAIETAREIPSHYFQGRALKRIVLQLVENGDLREAHRVAEMIQEAQFKIESFTKIASSLKVNDLPRAVELFRECVRVAQQNVGPEMRSYYLVAVLNEYAKVDLEHAIEIARGLDRDFYRAHAFYKITITLAKEDPLRALEMARENGEVRFRAKAIAAVATEIAQDDPELASNLVREAIEVAGEIECVQLRAITLGGVAEKQAVLDQEEARKTVNDVFELVSGLEGNFRRQALERIKKRQERYDPDAVNDTLKMMLQAINDIEHDESRWHSLKEYGAEIAEADLEGTIEAAKDINHYHYGSMALAVLAPKLAKVDFARAFEMVREIEYPASRAKALARISAVL